MNDETTTQRGQITSLLAVIGSALAFAFIVTGFFLYQYGPTGKYLVSNALISPDLLSHFDYNDTNNKTGGSSRFVFDSIIWQQYDLSAKTPKEVPITLPQYEQIYRLIRADLSLADEPPEVFSLFSKGKNPSLLIKVRTESHAAWQDETKIFQSIMFVKEGNYYRIQLHEEKNSNQWVYFYHPGIYEELATLIHLGNQ